MMHCLIERDEPWITQKGITATIDFYHTLAIAQAQLPGLNMYVTGIQSPSLNVVIDTRKNPTFNDKMVHDVAQFFEIYQVLWGWFMPGHEYAAAIEEQGFSLLYEAPSMYADLSDALPQMPKHLIVREATVDLTDWISCVQDGFPSADGGAGYRKLHEDLLRAGENKLRHFTGYYQEEVVVAGTLFLSDDTAMIHNLATLSPWRKQGFGSALMLYMMTLAKQTGFKHGFLDASTDGFNLYTKLGFKVYRNLCLYGSYTSLT